MQNNNLKSVILMDKLRLIGNKVGIYVYREFNGIKYNQEPVENDIYNINDTYYTEDIIADHITMIGNFILLYNNEKCVSYVILPKSKIGDKLIMEKDREIEYQ